MSDLVKIINGKMFVPITLIASIAGGVPSLTSIYLATQANQVAIAEMKQEKKYDSKEVAIEIRHLREAVTILTAKIARLEGKLDK